MNAAGNVRGPAIDGPSAWLAADVAAQADVWTLPLPPACWVELEAALAALRGFEGAVHEIGLQGLALEQTRRFAQALRRDHLDANQGFAVVEGLPVDRCSKEDITRAYWLLASLVSRPVEQTHAGRMLFDVRDVGLASQMVPGSGIRATVTNLDLNFHNDNCFNTVMPDHVGLLCLRSARSGGVSKLISFHTVHNILSREHPELLERLYQPIWWDRHKEFGAGEAPFVANPVFELRDGLPVARFSNYNIRGGYRLRDEALDPVLEAAMTRLVTLFADPLLQLRFTMQAGQIQFVNNRIIGHARSEFQDHEDEDRKRHLVRLWLRDWGTVRYEGH